MYQEKEAFSILKILFYLHVEILHRGYLVLTAALCNRLHHKFTDIPSPYSRVTTALSSHYQQLPSDRQISCNDTFHLHILCLCSDYPLITYIFLYRNWLRAQMFIFHAIVQTLNLVY